MFYVLLFHDPLVDVVDEFAYPLQVILCVFLDVVVSRHLDEVWRELLVHHVLPEPLPVANMHDFVALSVDYVYWTVEVFDAINIGKLIKA